MAVDLAADVRLLEDVHALHGQRIVEADVGGDLGELAGVAERLEHRVEVVHGVTDLVDAQRLVLHEPPVGVERLGLEEAPDPGAGVDELAVADPLLLVGGEDRAVLARLERGDDLGGPFAQRGTVLGRREVLDRQEAVTPVAGELVDGEHAASVRRPDQPVAASAA